MLRNLVRGDLGRVHQLNQAAVPAVGSATQDHLAALVEMAATALVAVSDRLVVGFVIVLGPGCDYASPNYAFFRERRDDFAYVDRIAIDPAAKGLGLGRQMYEEVVARSNAPVLCAEVNIRPMNADSLAFHARMGFQPVGEQDVYDGATRVRMLERPT